MKPRRKGGCWYGSFATGSLLLVAGCLMAPDGRTDEVTFMSFNIRFASADDGENSWRRRRSIVFDVIRREAPDVLGLQEAEIEQVQDIIDNVEGYFFIARENDHTMGWYNAILFRQRRFTVLSSDIFWFSDTPGVTASRTWGNGISRACTWVLFGDRITGGAFYVYNLHLDNESAKSRVRSVQLLADRIAERRFEVPLVVMGDFNADENDPVMLFLREGVPDADGDDSISPSLTPKLVDTYRVVYPDATEVGTVHGFRGWPGGRKIDAILASWDWDVLDAKIVRANQSGRYPSDHFPVTATLRQLDCGSLASLISKRASNVDRSYEDVKRPQSNGSYESFHPTLPAEFCELQLPYRLAGRPRNCGH